VARAAGVYAVLLLAVLVTPLVLRPLARVAGLPFGLFLGLEERLARAAISRDRGRITLTLGALVVGLAMVVGLGTVTGNARLAATAWLADVVPGDEVLTAIAPVKVGDGGTDAGIANIDGVKLATPIATFGIAFEGSRVDAEAIRGADFDADGRLTFTAGDRSAALAALDAGGAVILPRSRAARMGVGVGDTIAVASVQGLYNLKVVGIVERSFPGRTGEAVLVGWTDALTRFGVQGADAIAVRFVPGKASTASVAVADLARQQALTVTPLAQIGGALVDALDRVFGLLDLLAIAAVIVAALGIVNTISMGTWERVRELGTLRAAGMSRRQVRRSVIVEAGILGLIGGVLGSAAGICIGVLMLVTDNTAVQTRVGAPWPTIGLALALGVSLAMLAAAQPARLAGARSIVSAVRGE
jgi:putative ABC transport system permease protein